MVGRLVSGMNHPVRFASLDPLGDGLDDMDVPRCGVAGAADTTERDCCQPRPILGKPVKMSGESPLPGELPNPLLQGTVRRCRERLVHAKLGGDVCRSVQRGWLPDRGRLRLTPRLRQLRQRIEQVVKR